MHTRINLWSMDGSADVGKSLLFTGFQSQVEAYFNKFGSLPAIGSIVSQDTDSEDKSSVIRVDEVEYCGVRDNSFVVSISLTVS